jgi:hypothetical protein
MTPEQIAELRELIRRYVPDLDPAIHRLLADDLVDQYARWSGRPVRTSGPLPFVDFGQGRTLLDD